MQTTRATTRARFLPSPRLLHGNTISMELENVDRDSRGHYWKRPGGDAVSIEIEETVYIGVLLAARNFVGR
jgi:hypothetical protein